MMKKYGYLLLLLIATHLSFGQTWQWAKRGGSSDNLDDTAGATLEHARNIITDSQKNIYFLSSVGINNLTIDGVPKTNFGDSTSKTDIALVSFACDGTYRWSKIIGGDGVDNVHSIQIDGDDNIYIAGKFGGCSDNNYPPRIDNDVILPQDPTDCSIIFMAKYNSDGVLQWFKRPQQAGVSLSIGYGQTTSRGLSIDNQGNLYWLVAIPPGQYADGAFNNTLSGTNWFIFKYDTTGNFQSSQLLDMQLGGTSGLYLKFFRNPNNGNFYITGRKDSTDVASIGGQNLSHTVFMAAFNSTFDFQWVRENTSTSSSSLFLYDLAFDDQNNIYIGGIMTGFNLESFIGYSIPESLVPGFLIKVNPTADSIIWGTHHNKGATPNGSIILNGDEIAYTNYCFSSDFTWGSQTLNVNASGQGTDVLFARFNRETGQCTSLNKIPGDVGYNDVGTALTVDASGDYILGGGIGHNLTVNGNTITSVGGQSDFFVAKFATQACSPLSVVENEFKTMQVYPNPTTGIINIKSEKGIEYEVYNILGSLVAEGVSSFNSGQSIVDISKLAAGTYILKIEQANGDRENIKVLKI